MELSSLKSSKSFIKFTGQKGYSILHLISQHNTFYIIGTTNGYLISIDPDTNMQIQNRQTRQSCIYCLAFDQSQDIWTGGEKEIHLYKSSDLQSAILLENLQMSPIKILNHHEECIIGLKWLDSGLISGSEDGKISFWDSRTGAVSNLLSIDSSILCFDVSCRKKIAAGSSDSTLALTEFGSEKNTEINFDEKIWAIKFLENGDLITGGHSGVIKVWDLNKFKVKNEIKAHESRVKSIDLSKDSRIMATAGFDQKVAVFDLLTNSAINVYYHEDWVRYVKIDEQHSRILSVADDETFANIKLPELLGDKKVEKSFRNEEKKAIIDRDRKSGDVKISSNYLSTSFTKLNEKDSHEPNDKNRFTINQVNSQNIKKVLAALFIVIIMLIIIKVSQ